MKYRKKPVIIEAHGWDGSEDKTHFPPWLKAAFKKTDDNKEPTLPTAGCAWFAIKPRTFTLAIAIVTREGQVFADAGDYIIQGIQGELYPCKPDIFAATYEEVAE